MGLQNEYMGLQSEYMGLQSEYSFEDEVRDK
jgi:hypothetical protein